MIMFVFMGQWLVRRANMIRRRTQRVDKKYRVEWGSNLWRSAGHTRHQRAKFSWSHMPEDSVHTDWATLHLSTSLQFSIKLFNECSTPLNRLLVNCVLTHAYIVHYFSELLHFTSQNLQEISQKQALPQRSSAPCRKTKGVRKYY